MVNIRRAVKILLIIFTIVALSLIAINLCDHLSVVGLKIVKWYRSISPTYQYIIKLENQSNQIFNAIFNTQYFNSKKVDLDDLIAYHYNPDYYVLMLPFFKIPKLWMLLTIFYRCVSAPMCVMIFMLFDGSIFLVFRSIFLIYDNGTLIAIIFSMTCIFGCFYSCYSSRTCLPNEPVTEV